MTNNVYLVKILDSKTTKIICMPNKHTAGKWKTVNNYYIGTDEEDTQTIAYLSDHRNRVSRSESETEANARIIANAPDLLRVLVGLLGKINDSSIDDWTDYIRNGDKIVEIEDALAVINSVDPDILEHCKLNL